MFFGQIEDDFIKYILNPPEPITTFYYKCDKVFYVEPLYEMVKNKDTYGILVLDLGEATIGYLKGKATSIFQHIDSTVPNKHNHGGQSALRFERLRDDAINDYFKRVSEACTEAFLNKDIKGIIIGGPALTKDNFIDDDKYLHHELRKMVLGTVNTSSTDESGIKETVTTASNLIESTEFVKEMRVLDKFWAELRKEAGLVVYGDDTLTALNQGRLDTLIVSESLETEQLEHLSDICETYGTKCLIVSKDSENGKMFCGTFKMGGLTRY